MGAVGRGALLLQLVEFAALLAAGSGQAGDRVGACVGSNRDNCIDMERCSVNIEGSTYDISSLRRAGGTTADAASGDGDYDYTVNPCEAVTPLPTGCTGATTSCDPAGCSAFQHTSDGLFCYAAGDVNSLEASFLDPASGIVGSPGQGITLYWGSPLSTCGSAGVFRRTVLRLICGSGQETLGQGVELPPANSCQYQVFMTTSAGCPVSVAWGVYFLIFFSVASVGYFGGGYAYNSRQQGLSGTDAVPHFEFWEQVPDLVKDGMYWSYEKAQSLRTGKNDYEEIKHSSGQQDML